MGTLGSDSYVYKQENETTTLLVYQRVFFWNMSRGAIISLCICLRLMKYRVVKFSTMSVHEKLIQTENLSFDEDLPLIWHNTSHEACCLSKIDRSNEVAS